MTPDQKFTLVNTILGANLAVAAILFGVLGFLYSVFAAFARRELPTDNLADETQVDLRPHPLLWYLKRVAVVIVIGLGISVLIAGGCFAWLLCPRDWILSALSGGVLVEVVFLFAIGCYVTYRLMPVYAKPE
jgi:hypothetical protein